MNETVIKNMKLSVVIPCYNEEDVLPILRQRLVHSLDNLNLSWEVILVNDGSNDSTLEILSDMHSQDKRFKVINFSRNFGHQTAILAGLSYATGDAIAIMDADLQDPPEILGRCLEKWSCGYEVVFAVRKKRKENVFKRIAYRLFYRILRRIADINIPLDSGDFCLIDRSVINVLMNMHERNIFVRGMRAWVGFRQIGVSYERENRAAGITKYPFRKLLTLALDGIFSFSTFPLRLATWLGIFIVGLCLLGVGFLGIWRIFGFEFMGNVPENIPGWTGVIVSILFLSGVQLLIIGILGEYLARIYKEVKSRPRWVVSSALGVPRSPDQVE